MSETVTIPSFNRKPFVEEVGLDQPRNELKYLVGPSSIWGWDVETVSLEIAQNA